MYHQINPTETFRERQLALLEEAEEWRLARRLGITRRTILLMATTIALTVLVVGGVALAATFTCTSGDCFGTAQDDHITGNEFANFIDAKAGNDTVQGRGSNDTVHGRRGVDDINGDGANDPTTDGGDTLFGEGRGDTLTGEGGVNSYFGGPGPDTIHADQSGSNAVETISGGPGNDTINANDGVLDKIQCGGGSQDLVRHDAFDVLSADCETRIGPG